MAWHKARTSLATLEEKLRRSLGLVGEIGALFQPTLTPVIIAGDLREAGNAANLGRAFAWSNYNGATGWAANQYQSVRFEADSLVTQIFLNIASGAAGVLQVWVTAPPQAPAVAPVTLAGTWVDRKMIAGDQVPLVQGVPGVLVGTDFTDQNRIANIATAGTSPILQQFTTNIMIPAGGALNFRGTAASGNFATFFGRIWP